MEISRQWTGKRRRRRERERGFALRVQVEGKKSGGKERHFLKKKRDPPKKDTKNTFLRRHL